MKKNVIKTKSDPNNCKKRKAASNENAIPKKQKFVSSDQNSIRTEWSDEEWLSQTHNIEIETAKNLMNLFENENSVPFIARYRRNLTNHMEVEQIREVKDSYELLKVLHKKIEKVAANLNTQGIFKGVIKSAVLNARTIEELEHIYSPYKPGAPKSLAERAKEQGLEEVATGYLLGNPIDDLKRVANQKSLQLDDVKEGILNIIAHIVCHDTDCLKNIRKWRMEAKDIYIETELRSKTKQSSKEKMEAEKFLNYSNYKINLNFIKPHQILAINRGENQKLLKVKINISDRIYNLYNNFCKIKWLNNGQFSSERKNILMEAFKRAYQKYLIPLIHRQIKSDLKSTAEKASIDVFKNNLKNMLLSPPCRDRILSIDPGYKHGCKFALISEIGSVLETGILYPKFNVKSSAVDEDGVKLKNVLEMHNCTTIGIGNGTACRDTENWLTELKKKNILPEDIKYTIVNESGASIYSCTPEAKKEFPKLDTNIISAISIARRLQDPLSELIKIEPKHLGVGMYQHDMKEKILSESLDEIVIDCVSFVGVNLNTASHCILSKIAGLNTARADSIIKHREKIGYFKNRKQLLDVKGIGAKVYEQSIGFLRVGPISRDSEASFYRQSDVNRLDRTWIHPESYDVAMKFLKKCCLKIADIGSENAIKQVKTFTTKSNISSIINELKTDEQVIKLIIEALTKSIDHDLRLEQNQHPLFKKECADINELKKGDILTGRVQNVTDFGSFVDVGVGKDGLIHNSKAGGTTLHLGDHVEVQVLEIDVSRGRISLLLKNVLQTLK